MIKFDRCFKEPIDPTIVFHVTRKNNLKSINTRGIVPNVPEDYGEDGDDIGVYCFPTLEDVENALYNWLGERIEDWEEETGENYDEVVLELDISGLEFYKSNDIDWEVVVKETIPPDRIIRVFEI